MLILRPMDWTVIADLSRDALHFFGFITLLFNSFFLMWYEEKLNINNLDEVIVCGSCKPLYSYYSTLFCWRKTCKRRKDFNASCSDLWYKLFLSYPLCKYDYLISFFSSSILHTKMVVLVNVILWLLLSRGITIQ